MNPTEADAEALGREELDRYSSGGGTLPGNDNSMDWEDITNAEAVDTAMIAPQIVSEVPGRTGVHVEDFDMETFSFESDEEEEDTDAKPSSGLSTSFDIQILKTAIEASAEALEMVTGKDVVMVTGKTGVGKSTLIQGIAGKRIHEVKHMASFHGEVATMSAYDAEDALPEFEIGHSKVSMTKSINALVRGELVYLDTPGVEDTSGVEMDIVTSALLSQVAKRCKSIKFVILIHCASLIEDRGGAFRSVLRFVRAYVQDFDKSKMSFIFLFTHAGEITGMSSSIVEAKKRLHEEIIRTAEGTKDDDVLVVLKFIRNCLKKDYPFVQIFNPIDMDYVHLTSTIENKLQKVLDLTLAKSPSLTLAAKMKLDSAALSLVQRIREALSAQDVNQVSDIRQTIQYLRGYVEVDCFRHAISDSTKLIDEYIRMLRSTISDHVSRGTSSDREFNEENIQVLKEMLQQLRSLDCPDSANRSLQTAERNVIEFADNIIAQACSFKHFHQGLKKAAVWAKGFEEFNPIYVRTCARITEFVHDMSSTLGRADISNIENWIDADILNVVRTLSNLNAMFEQSTQFPNPHLDVQTSINAINLAMQKLDSVFESWLSNAERFAKSSSFIEYENDLESIVKHVHTLEIILSAMKDQSPIFHPLDQHVRLTLKELENHVLGRFNQCCATMKGTSFDPRWKSQLFWMRDVCSRFDNMNGICWKQTKSSFFAIIDAIKSSLHRASGELDNMSKLVGCSGMISGKSFANELKALESHQWIDSFLPADQKVISACCNRVREVVDRRIETNRALLELMIFISCVTPFKLIQNIGRMLPELLELGKYSEIVGGIRGEICCGLAPRCVTYLQSFTVYLSILAKKCLIFWSSNAKSGRRRIGYMRSITRKLNSILAVIEDLLITGASDIVLQESREIQTMFHDSFAEFKKAVQSEFSSLEGSFDTKSAYLVTIQACIGFSHVERQLINYRKVQQITRDLVSKEAAKLEASIEESSDWDRIDQSLLKFGVATVLDNFIGGDVTSRLRTLQRLRDQKEHQVDDLMATMIQNRDFKGIGEFLRPLSNSKDQVKRQKLESHLSVISSHLKEILHEIDRLIDINSNLTSNSRPVAKKIEVLIAAESDLGRLLSSQLNLTYELRKLKQCMNGIICHFTKQITTATKDKDYIQMLRNIRQGNDFLSNMQHHLIQRNIGSFKSAVDKSKMELKAVPRYVKQFFESKFEDGDDLIKAMNSLKQVKGTGSFPKLAEKYELEKKDFEAKVAQKIQSVKTIVSHSQCYDELIIYVHSLHRQLQGALKDHCSHHLVTECLRLTEELRCQKNCTDRFLELDGSYYHQNLDKLSHQLDTLSSPSIFEKVKIFFSSSSYDNKTYKRLCNELLGIVERRFKQAIIALKARDLVSVQESIEFLELVYQKADKHVQIVGCRLQDLRNDCIAAFSKLCDEAKLILSSDNCTPFKEIFIDYRGYMIHIPCVLQSSDGRKGFVLINQMLHESLEKAVRILRQLAGAEILESSRIKAHVQYSRSWGSFLADHLTLLHEEVNSINAEFKSDKWLANINKVCWDYFTFGRDLSKLKYCAVLGVLPSASQKDINKAFKLKAKQNHPDKTKASDGADFRKTKEAQEELLKMSHLTAQSQEQPFDKILLGVGEAMRDHAKSFMNDQRYDMMEKMLFELNNIPTLDDLVESKLNSDKIKSSIYEIVKGIVKQSRVEVESNWSARNYKDLNMNISTLKNMEQHFKAYPQIFPKSWDTGICSTIEAEIESLGQKASACLQSRAIAEEKQGDFRRCFIQMGFVLIELPCFKNFTKSVMSCVLETCLDSGWGYAYLFELGLSLQKGDDASSEDESRVAQMIVTEFSHFKEVLVMVWNEEVSQKPAEDVVKHIKGEVHLTPTKFNSLDIDQIQLLNSFMSYEREYKSLVGDYIKPDADLNLLVQKTLALARQAAPLANAISWSEDLKAAIPAILAGVFSLLTVVKSGASYNRIEEATGSSDLGEKLLMKPHNIQVLSLLFMLGCGKSGKTSLENQLMQIRTGEGKSMILGAASVMFALLGFKVRTVCYSEYLSDRDFRLFEDVFNRFGLSKYIVYSKITMYAEDTTALKGDIRGLTESLLRGNMSPTQSAPSHCKFASSVTQPTISVRSNISKAVVTPLADGPRLTRSNSNRKRELEIGEDMEDNDDESQVINGERANDDKTAQLSANYARLSCNTDPISGELTKKRNFLQLSASSDESEVKNVSSIDEDRNEILLVDEVDVFFGNEFYGQTYNQVVEIREPEIQEILKKIWTAWNQGGRRLKLNDIRSMPEYSRLLSKLSSFSFLLENEISLMLDQVSKVDDIPYYLDAENDCIGYKVMDSISYDVTYGYSTCFAYLKESPKLKNKGTLARVLAMPVSCGRFSYANISPYRILGVSGTLQSLSEHEREILLKYGLNKFIYVPSVYGSSNFDFDKAGEGIKFENSKSDFFHRISAEIASSTKAKRAVVVFFRDSSELDEFVRSPTYRQLSRHKKLLTEDMPSTEKSYVISKAATAGQITLSTAVFGRGTDFFCKDEAVQSNGGVHIIQTFLSDELSEEIQIQGRTARQGKKGSYQLVLLEQDLELHFGVPVGEKDKIPRKDLYDWLCKVRLDKHKKRCQLMQENLVDATDKDTATHCYFDRLLAHNIPEAKVQFEELYRAIKKPPMPSSLILDIAFAVDVTGSMAPYSKCVMSTITSLISGNSSILKKLKSAIPEIEFQLRVGVLGFRDIDDKQQFQEMTWNNGGHFSDNIKGALQCISTLSGDANGGGDIAEDLIGAIHHCSNAWNHTDDWTSDVKCLILFSDAPSHGLVAPLFSNDSSYDSYPTHNPSGLKLNDAISSLLAKDIDLYFCSFDPNSTNRTEIELANALKKHPENKSDRGMTSIPMVPKGQQNLIRGRGKHIIFVLDESGSMQHLWSGVVEAYRKYIEKRMQSQSDSDLVSVVQFDSHSRITVANKSLSRAPTSLSIRGGGTQFYPAALEACKLARETPSSHTPSIIFMSDGGSEDAPAAAKEFSVLNNVIIQTSGKDLELHVIAFGSGADNAQLQQIANASKAGKVYTSANVADLASLFVSIAANSNIATVLESEIAKRLSEAVSEKLSLEYFGR